MSEVHYTPLPDNIVIPKHIAFSPNGNRRWGKEQNNDPLSGHFAGSEALLALIEAGHHYGIHTLTFWGFSTENWNRSEEEIEHLMQLFEYLHDEHKDTLSENDTRIVHLGRKDRLPLKLVSKIASLEEHTKNNQSHVLNIGLDYGGHDELMRAAISFANDMKDGVIQPNEIYETNGWYIKDKIPYYTFKNYLDTKDQPHPYPDVVVRMGGDKRTSGFLPWQAAYAEYIWYDEFFPEFTHHHMHDVIIQFNGRERRFGGDGKCGEKQH